MNNQLYINEILIPLSPESTIALSFQINNIASTDIRGNNSNTFTLKAHAQTNHALGFANLPTSATRIPYRQLPARYLQNGVDLLKGGGYAVVQEYRPYESEFDVELYSGNLDFFALIDGKSIRDLNLSAYNHPWNAVSISASFAKTAGYVYPLIDYGTLEEKGNELRTDRLFPAVYLHTLINQIFFEAGFEPEGNILSDIRHQKIILPFTEGKPAIADNFGADRSFRAGPAFNQFISYNLNEQGDKPVLFADDSTERLNFFDGKLGRYNASTGEYTVSDTCLADIKASLVYQGTASVGSVRIRLKMSVNGVTRVEALAEESGSVLGGSFTSKILTLDAPNFTFQAGDVVKLLVNLDASGTFFFDFDFNLVREAGPAPSAFWSIAVQDELPVGGEWKVARNLPDLSQTDLLKNWAQLFGLIFQTDSPGRKVSVRGFGEIAANAPLAKDFTAKLVTSRTTRQSWRLDYAQVNHLRYAPEDTPEGGPLFVEGADGEFSVDDRNLPPAGDLFEMAFSATRMVPRLGNVLFAHIPLFEDFENSGSTNPRLLIMDRQDVPAGLLLAGNAVSILDIAFVGIVNYVVVTTERPHGFAVGQLVSIRGLTGTPQEGLNVTDAAIINTLFSDAYRFAFVRAGSAAYAVPGEERGRVFAFTNPQILQTAVPIPYFILPNKSFNLGFGNNLIEKNYGRLVAMLNPLQVQEAYFKLSETDIAELDQFIPVWIEPYGAYYFLQQIKDFEPNTLTRCILIRL